MTPREKQMKFRESVKGTIACLAFISVPIIMCLHWLIIGY